MQGEKFPPPSVATNNGFGRSDERAEIESNSQDSSRSLEPWVAGERGKANHPPGGCS